MGGGGEWETPHLTDPRHRLLERDRETLSHDRGSIRDIETVSHDIVRQGHSDSVPRQRQC